MAASPTQASLDRALERATQVRIKDVPQLGGTEHLLITDPDSVRQLARLLIIEPPATPFHCMCFGNQLLEFAVPWRRDVCITLHHGCSIRWQQWDSDALLADGVGRGRTQPPGPTVGGGPGFWRCALSSVIRPGIRSTLSQVQPMPMGMAAQCLIS